MTRALVQPSYPGRTDGSAIPTGNIGYTIEGNTGAITCASLAATNVWANAFSQSMPAGKWLVFASTSNTTAGISGQSIAASDVGTVGGAVPADALEGGLNFAGNNGNTLDPRISGVLFVKSSTWTLYIAVKNTYTSGSVRVQFRALEIG